MTSWLLAHGSSVPLCVLLGCVVLAVCAEASSGGTSVCWSPSITSCAECLRRGPQCAWCFKEDFLRGAEQSHRCDLSENLRRRGCDPEFMEQLETKVEVNATLSSTQVSPRDISITLRPGSEASFIVAVKQLEHYPVDLYYLVDVSASMQENLDHLKTVGVALSLRMTEYTSDLWMGFGSFVDKPVSPYINVHPSKINNPCSDYEIRCRPAHGFHHVLSMTGNMTEFTRVIKRQRISGNMDTPEGGLDAMLQAAVCQGAVGWRPEAKRLLLLMTDQPSHLALDSRLAGIVVPHDGLCHLENNIYTGSTKMDHPSLGQLSDKLLENHIYPIFAVEKQQYQWYEELVDLIPGSYLGKLGLFHAPNLIELVADAYKTLLSEVAVSVSVEDKAVSRFWVSVSPLCPDGSTAKDQRCSGVQPDQTVYFNITIGQHSCDDDGKDEDVTVMVRPVGYNESTVVRIHSKCRCNCGTMGRCHDDDQAPCRGAQHGISQEPRPDTMKDSDPSRNCRADGSNLDCSGRGVCECGRCVCEQSKLGVVFGKYCEMDDFSCLYEGEVLCGGRGVCSSGECVCVDGWTGVSCGCPTSTASCQSSNGLLCSGRGRCVCGKCVCDDPKLSGNFCERCPTCQSTQKSTCKSVNCNRSHGLSQKEAEHCKTCAPLIDNLNDVSERVSSRRLVGTFLSVCALTLLCGLVVVAVSRLLLQKRGRSSGGAVEDGGYHCTGKDLSYIPTTNEKTVTYRRDRPPDRPVEMHIQVPKMPLGDPWQC
ncbi:integrin beta-8 isoform X1 [Melanotaenia boesemani]|uniref:integrin beta-8 isoform X1 n=2 Tax=Melanotaenia boesemani TaxID=1250792 RepID=UPI001C043ECD|nr:integrin beta-8 isoform X1 [Melanotaenia boesemani]